MTTPTREELLKLAIAALEDSNELLRTISGEGVEQSLAQIHDNLNVIDALLSAHQAQGEHAPAGYRLQPISEFDAMSHAQDQAWNEAVEAAADRAEDFTGAADVGSIIRSLKRPLQAQEPAKHYSKFGSKELCDKIAEHFTPAAQSGARDSQPSLVTDDLPPLPAADHCYPYPGPNDPAFTAAQMHDYARAAVELSRAQTAPAVDLASVSDETVYEGNLRYPKGYCTDPSGAIIAPAGRRGNFSFGYDLGYSDGLSARNDALGRLGRPSAPVSEQPEKQEGWMKYFAAERLKNEGFDGYKLTVHGSEYSTYTNEFEYLLKAMLAAAPQPVAEQVGEQQEFNIEAAAKKLSECMDYPWDHMPEQGRQSMREITQRVLAAAHPQATQAKEPK